MIDISIDRRKARRAGVIVATNTAGLAQRVAAVRGFNRFYTQKIGVLQEGLLSSPFALTEVRVLYELAHWPATRDPPTASRLAADLGLDGGYLSRILRRFERSGLIRRKPSAADGRQNLLSLTGKGREAFAPLEARSRAEVRAMLGRLSEREQARLTAAMREIERLLGAAARSPIPCVLRSHRAGDIGWIVHRHGVLYAQEYSYDQQFEALVAEIAAKFVQNLDAKRERCWVAERDGAILGSVFLVKQSKTVGKLRLLLVEPAARGVGLGTRLVDECVRFARRVGYRKIVLWTQSELVAARQIYERAGFRRVREEPHHSFGRDLIAETWELAL
jgi:DNA-binding MarR family transcriptional regulator/N-acetylglutamate synthase-like GNAT family acetyltransferase